MAEGVDGDEGGLRVFLRDQLLWQVPQSQLAYVKQEKEQVMIHYYQGDDLQRASFSTRGANREAVKASVAILARWQKDGSSD